MSKHQRILVTGGTSGIGKALAENLSGSIYTMGRSEGADISCDFQDIHAVCNTPLPENITTLICNAGMGLFGNLEELSHAQIDALMTVNTLSHIHLVRRLIPSLKKQERADIIFIGSEAARIGKRKGTVYCASKWALRGFAYALRDECSSSSVNVSIINPGMVRTPFFDTLSFEPGDAFSHAIEPNDIVEAVRAILSMRPGTVVDEITLSPKQHVVKKKEFFRKNA